MDRNKATQLLRKTLDDNQLHNWKIRLNADIRIPLGSCIHRDKTILLNALHIDTHPEPEIIDTIYHEVAHALVPSDAGHGILWQDMAVKLGAKPTACASISLDASVIDALRSGSEIAVEFDYVPKYRVTRLQEKCPVCGKVAKQTKRTETETHIVITLECGHFIIKAAAPVSKFNEIIFDGLATCKHSWKGTVCQKCNAKKLFPYQIEGAKALERANGKFAIFDEMGLGKTIQALAYLKFHPEMRPFIWTTKSGTMFQHVKEIVRVLGDKDFPQVIRDGKIKSLIPGLNVVCSYDIFRRIADVEKLFAGYKCIILDECQAIKNPDSSRTQCVRKIVKNTPGVIPLSGTPWKNRGSEFFVALNLLDPVLFYSFEAFKNRHVHYITDDVTGKVKEAGIRNPEQFKELIAHLAIRRERAEVMPELPLVNRTKQICEVPPEARVAYKAVEDELVAAYNEAVIGGEEDSFANSRAAMVSLMLMKQIVGIAKVPSTVEYAKEFLEETDRKLVIFVAHIKCGDLIQEQMEKWCLENGEQKPLRITGGMNPVERFSIANAFNGPNHRLLIASTLASGEGLNLQTCSDCIMHERQWNPANEEQAEGRFVRIGQTAQSVNAIYVHGDDTVDTTLDGIVERKRIAFHNTMNKTELVAWSENDILKELIKDIAARRKRK